MLPKTPVKGLAELAAEANEYVALMEDGRLFISKTHRFLPEVSGFIGKLRRLNIAYETVVTDLATVNQMRLAGRKKQASATMSKSETQRYASGLFERAVEKRVSDIHIRVSKVRNTEIFFRIHGDLQFEEEHSFEWGDQLCATIYTTMTDVSDSTFKPMVIGQDARIADRAKIPKSVDGIRIATSPQVDGYLMVLRLLYNDTVQSDDVVDYGFHQTHSQALRLMRRRPFGIHIIAGPTGSGKSTTLQCVLSAIHTENQGRKHIITVEDPPEYPIVGAVQTPVTNAETEEERRAAFQSSIKKAMRLDPDVIMIGEVRDGPSARLAFQAAMTGHQVWTTIHANGAFEILDRLLDLEVPLDQLANHRVLSGLIAQRLVKVLCPKCKVPFRDAKDNYLPEDTLRIMRAVHNADRVFVLGKGCPDCRGTGIVGRTVVAETVTTDAYLMSLVRRHDRMAAIDYWLNGQQGMTMVRHAIEKVESGIADPFMAEDVVGFLNMDMIEADHRISQAEVASVVQL